MKNKSITHWTVAGGTGQAFRTACGLTGAPARNGFLSPKRATCHECCKAQQLSGREKASTYTTVQA